LIERAGWAVAGEALDLLGGGYGRRVVVIAGKGNNGADGRCAARFRRARRVHCTVLDAAEPALAHHRPVPPVGPDTDREGRSSPDEPTLPPADLIIDAAYGTGFRGTYLRPRPHRNDTPVLAVDIPSGIDGTTGEASGEPWRATRTVTFAALKPGLLLGEGPEHAGW